MDTLLEAATGLPAILFTAVLLAAWRPTRWAVRPLCRFVPGEPGPSRPGVVRPRPTRRTGRADEILAPDDSVPAPRRSSTAAGGTGPTG